MLNKSSYFSPSEDLRNFGENPTANDEAVPLETCHSDRRDTSTLLILNFKPRMPSPSSAQEYWVEKSIGIRRHTHIQNSKELREVSDNVFSNSLGSNRG